MPSNIFYNSHIIFIDEKAHLYWHIMQMVEHTGATLEPRLMQVCKWIPLLQGCTNMLYYNYAGAYVQ